MIRRRQSAAILFRLGSLAVIGVHAAAMTSASAGTMATTPELRQAAMMSCTGDVFRLCPSVMFDEQKIFACMKANRSQLTPGCGAVFDRGAKTVPR